ncbi:MAG TPA: Mrp/NBP35 family ATP-binding protein [Phycisphaerae bacterium]|jgi:ATP-binding protein involved in chromosome partitioning
MSPVTKEQVLEQLRTVKDPELHRDLVSLNMIKNVAVCDGHVKVHVELTTPACPMREQVQQDVEAAIRRIPGVQKVEIELSAQVRAGPAARPQLPGIKNIIAVGAGKGGVGKSTAAVLLAIGLRRAGAVVGLMDADVYGPSIPTMTGVEGMTPVVNGDRIMPVESHDVKIMSIGFMVQRDQPLIWRGPMVHGVIKQFLEQVEWGQLDYLIVDLPPGTGDVPLTLAQSIPMTGAVVICTPQDVALIDARRAVRMYEQLNVPSLGIIENMSYYLCPKCGHRDEIFDHGGADMAARELGVPFLGEIPLNADIRRFADAGTPEATFTKSQNYVVAAIERVVNAVAGQVSVKNLLQVAAPTLSIE